MRASLAAAALAALVYANALGNGFAYDDIHIVVDNTALHELGRLPDVLFHPYWPGGHGQELGLWRPVTSLAYALQYAAWGGSAAGFHLVNVLLHASATALVVLLLAELVPVTAALAGGLLFAVHPVHVEAVSNVVGMAELLAAVPYLGACLILVRGGSRTSPGRVALLAGLYALAFLSKESAVTLPAALLLLDAARERLALSDLRYYARRRGVLYLVLGAVAVVLLMLRYRVLGSLANPDPALGAHLLRDIPRIWTLGLVWTEYVRLLLFPATLYADYGPGVIPILTGWSAANLAGVGAVLAVLVLALVSWRRGPLVPGGDGWRIVGVGVLWFVITASPVSNVFFLSGVLVAERTLYLPSVGVAAALGWGVWRLAARNRAAAAALLAGAVVLLAARTWTRTPVWRSTESVFAHMIQDEPTSGRAQWVLGDILWEQGRRREARRAYRLAVGFLDSTHRLLAEVGRKEIQEGSARTGEFLLRRAAEDRPPDPGVARHLAVLYEGEGRSAEAVRFARVAIAVDSTDVLAWHILAGTLADEGSWAAAARARERVLSLGEDDHWQQWLSLANLRLTLADSAGARAALDEALARAGTPDVRASIRAGFHALAPR